MKLKLKICGMRDPDNITQVAALDPDYMGFIFYENSKRFVGNNFIIPTSLSNKIKRVGVFVNEETKTILKKANEHQLDYIQLHGNESVGECKSLTENGIGVIKVFAVAPEFDFNQTKQFEPHVDFFLFDTKSDNYGGSGKSFDWNLLNNYDQHVPFFLSGGLSSENISAASKLKNMNLHAVDVNSGVELSTAMKSLDKIKSLISTLKSEF